MGFVKRLLWAAGLCALTQGCGLIATATRTVVIEPLHYCQGLDELVECRRNRKLAEEAWAAFQQGCPEAAYSEDFAKGFKAGFADFLFAGGAGAPPALPPRHYWGPKYQTPEGRRAVADWFAGFSQGAGAARDSGLRRFIEVPASAPVASPPPTAAAPSPGPEPDTQPALPLPPPRPLEQPPAGGPPDGNPASQGEASAVPTRPAPPPERPVDPPAAVPAPTPDADNTAR